MSNNYTKFQQVKKFVFLEKINGKKIEGIPENVRTN